MLEIHVTESNNEEGKHLIEERYSVSILSDTVINDVPCQYIDVKSFK